MLKTAITAVLIADIIAITLAIIAMRLAASARFNADRAISLASRASELYSSSRASRRREVSDSFNSYFERNHS